MFLSVWPREYRISMNKAGDVAPKPRRHTPLRPGPVAAAREGDRDLRGSMMAAYARSLFCLRAGSRQSGWQTRALAAAADELFSVKRSGPRAESLEAGRMPQRDTSVDDQVTLEAKARAHTNDVSIANDS